MKVSVLTLVRGRHRHLTNLLHGLNAQHRPPDELIIAWMQDRQCNGLPAADFPIRHLTIGGRSMPLAAARNAAAAAARCPGLVFLDVDCIASPMLIDNYGRALARQAGLYLGEVRYLPDNAVRLAADGTLDYERLDALGQAHPARPRPPRHGIRLEPDPGQLWGLSFALRAETHAAVGGMDEHFVGYGGEETDYAFRLAAAEVALYWVGQARAWHQYHCLYRPPLQHFEAIIANARRFYARWQRWCMDYWLGMFADAGLIDWHPCRPQIVIRRYPRIEEIRACRLGPQARWA